MIYYLCARILNDRQYTTTTKSYGLTDIRPIKNMLPFEIEALKESLRSSNEISGIKNLCCIVTIVEAESLGDAIRISHLIFEETLDFYESQSITFYPKPLTDVGYILNLCNFEIKPIIPEMIYGKKLQSHTFHIIPHSFPTMDPYQYILSLKFLSGGDMIKNIVRSAHWYRLARTEVNKSLSFLFLWVAIETLSKLNIYDDIIPKICLCLGFPLSKSCKIMDKTLLKRLTDISGYREWRNELKKRLVIMRKYRDDIVHNGFRIHEITMDDILFYNDVLTIGYSRMRDYCIRAIYEGIIDKNEVWEYMPLLVEANDNLINDVGGTIIFSWNNKTYLQIQ